MFDKNKGNFGKCNCPHCRGGHGQSNDFNNFNNDFSFDSGQNIEVQADVLAIDLERADPHDLVDQYLEAVLQCESPEEVEEVMFEFFDEVFVHAMQETYISEIEGKIMALNLLKEGFVDELDEDE